ncbi:FecR domain-containing protein [Chitinophaga horti]|uniref:FecR domain-containing protein n=1 Tax=Chitinophaga horti TaxID=2920382 RepID=A0ABY6IXS8_9BACT|nr:FecR family protein [Chitinophaga horti]UYQ92053.1 FecR domain-containing protein [Chitinophaga horti]
MNELHPDEALYTLLCKYLLNEADGLERQWVDTWRADNAANEAVLEGVRKMLEAPAPVQTVVNTEASWQRLLNTIQPEGAKVVAMPGRKQRRWLPAAAVILAIVAAGVGVWNLTSGPGEKTLVFNGVQEQVLPDGSKVRLDSASELRVAQDFGKKERRVYLKGKAFFDITADEQHPFEVQMNEDMMVRVLGTQFSIDFRENRPLDIHVTSGKIMVMNNKEQRSLVMTPGMLLRQPEPNRKPYIVDHVVDVEKLELSFEDAPLSDVIETVEAIYNVKFEVKDTGLLKTPITTNFNNRPIAEVVETLAYMNGISITQKAPGIYIVE